MRTTNIPAADWATSPDPVPYAEAVRAMERRATAIAELSAPELVWLLEHPPIYTAGTSARATDLIKPSRFPVFETGRGGQYTYHGPGQRVVYLMLDVRQRFGSDVRAFVTELEDWIAATLAEFGLEGVRRSGRTGIWVRRSGSQEDAKIAALGVRIVRGVSMHGISINVAPDLSHYDGIVPCGIRDAGVTSFADQGMPVSMMVLDGALLQTFEHRFGSVNAAPVLPAMPQNETRPASRVRSRAHS